jgi:periplasmic protein TonB
MKSTHTIPASFALVLVAHLSVLAAIIYTPEKPAPLLINPPTIQGAIVASEPLIQPPEPTPPPPPQQQKPLPTPKIPVPKAPPSERAIVQDEPPLAASQPTEQPTEAAEPTAAPVVLPQADASELNNPAPAYPALSKRLNEQGTVVLDILVKADGSIGDIQLKTSSGYPRLDDAALRAIKNWRFVPASRGGDAIDYRYDLPFEFTLNH